MRLVIGLLLLFPITCLGESVSIKDGNVFFTRGDGREVQLTSDGLDSDPSLSLDSKKVVFVRRTPGYLIDTGRGDVDENELWIAAVDRRSKPRLVLRGRSGNFRDNLVLAGFYLPRFSADARRVYFLATTWATSDAIHSLDLSSGKTQFIAAGHSVEPINYGRFKKYAFVRTDTMGRQGGHIDDYWLYNPEGKAVKRIGGELELKAFLRSIDAYGVGPMPKP